MSMKRVEQAEELQLRVLQVADLATLLGSDAFENGDPDDLEDFLDAGHVRTHHSVKPIYDAITDRDPEDMGMALYSRGLNGLLMQVGTPLRKHSKERTWLSSWGNYYTGWVYGNTYEEAWEQAMDWAKERHAANLAEWKAGAA